MNNNTDQTSFFLPKLKSDHPLINQTQGVWTELSWNAFEQVSDSLDVKPPAQGANHISSTPDMWARALSMEMALHIEGYPIQAQMVTQWRGMLAAIAFADLKKFPLTVQHLDLQQATSNAFAQALVTLSPSQANVLYTKDNSNVWLDLYLFLWKDKPVGLTSPSTLVCSSEEGQWDGLPWWDHQKGWTCPSKHLSEDDKHLLVFWLEYVSRFIADKDKIHKGKETAIDKILGYLKAFQRDLTQRNDIETTLSKVTIEALQIRLHTSDSFFGTQFNWGILQSLNKPLVVPDIFLSELFFIDSENTLPGCYLPLGADQLKFNGRKVFPLIPLKPEILNSLKINNWSSKLKIEFKQQQVNDGSKIKITVKLPLSNDNTNITEYLTVDRDYEINSDHVLNVSTGVVLDLWPYFQAEDWKEYYAFYSHNSKRDLQVDFPGDESHTFADNNSTFKISKLSSFPFFATCQHKNQSIGLIFLSTPPDVIPQADDGNWTVGVDFGTSSTNVCFKKNTVIKRLEVESLHLKVIGGDEIRNLFEYFIPILDNDQLPLASVLTTRNKRQQVLNIDSTPFFDGRIYIPESSMSFSPSKGWIQTNLKWSINASNIIYSQLFLKHLALQIAASAKKRGVNSIDFHLSYPIAFSKNDKTLYLQHWQSVTQHLSGSTGIKLTQPNDENAPSFCSESMAIARYFKWKRFSLVNSACIDIGGGTSDISIWQNNELIHQCSIRFAGQHLLSQFLELNPNFLKDQFNLGDFDDNWKGLQDSMFSAKLDIWLRKHGEQWLKSNRITAVQNQKFKGLISLMALGFSGIYYYIGIVINVLAAEEKSKYLSDNVPAMYLGGNGTRLLNWLCIGGEFSETSDINNLLSRMMNQGAKLSSQIVQKTHISEHLKDEVACGLISGNNGHASPFGDDKKDTLIAGEDFKLDGKDYSWEQNLLQTEISDQKLEIHEVKNLQNFLNQFNIALRELKVGEINPVVNCDDQFWHDVKTELADLILNMQSNAGSKDDTRLEPPFILALKAMLTTLAKKWAS